MPTYSYMYFIDAGFIDAGLLIAYSILITHALAGVAKMLPSSGSHPVGGL